MLKKGDVTDCHLEPTGPVQLKRFDNIGGVSISVENMVTIKKHNSSMAGIGPGRQRAIKYGGFSNTRKHVD